MVTFIALHSTSSENFWPKCAIEVSSTGQIELCLASDKREKSMQKHGNVIRLINQSNEFNYAFEHSVRQRWRTLFVHVRVHQSTRKCGSQTWAKLNVIICGWINTTAMSWSEQIGWVFIGVVLANGYRHHVCDWRKLKIAKHVESISNTSWAWLTWIIFDEGWTLFKSRDADVQSIQLDVLSPFLSSFFRLIFDESTWQYDLISGTMFVLHLSFPSINTARIVGKHSVQTTIHSQGFPAPSAYKHLSSLPTLYGAQQNSR